MDSWGRDLIVIAAVMICGCSTDPESDQPREPAPRPVSVITLQESDPSLSLNVTGQVGSWKTEDIGFEVSGRVQYVIEPETNVDVPFGEETGQELARIDPGGLYRQIKAGDQFPDAGNILCSDPSQPSGKRSCHAHAGGHGFTMQPFTVTGAAFYRVAESVAKVQ